MEGGRNEPLLSPVPTAWRQRGAGGVSLLLGRSSRARPHTSAEKAWDGLGER